MISSRNQSPNKLSGFLATESVQIFAHGAELVLDLDHVDEFPVVVPHDDVDPLEPGVVSTKSGAIGLPESMLAIALAAPFLLPV